jgi:ubiquinone/menaquinone biosynthesis C-methylase UbiE
MDKPLPFPGMGLFNFYLYQMKDNFSRQADVYAKYRPDYPKELFDFILSHINNNVAAWDCATGNGQTAKELAKYFEKVYATDISQKQLDNAAQASNIFYSLQPAEQTNFPDHQFDLVTVSQALHWLQFEKFYTEVNRVTKPGGYLAVWMYGGLSISPEIDRLKKDHYSNTLGAYWDMERQHVDDNYTSIPFPFEEIKCPSFKIQFHWTIEELRGYLNTWSALQKFIAANNYNPVDELVEQIRPYWTKERMEINFPVTLRMGQIKH